MRKAAGIALSGIGIVILVLGILMGTAWRPAAEIFGSTTPSGSGYVVTAPGVLDLTNRSVHVTVTAPQNDEIQFASGYSDDVAAYTAGYATQSINGVASTRSLKVSATEGLAPAGNLTDADMWLVKKTATGRLDADYNVTLPGQEVIVVSTASGAMPRVTLHWERTVGPSLAVPTGLVGALLLLAGLLLLALDIQRGQAEKRSRKVDQDELERREVTRRAETTVIPKITLSDDEPAARSSRSGSADEDAPAADREEIARTTGGMLGVGIIPTSTHTEEIRARESSPEAVEEATSAWLKHAKTDASADKRNGAAAPGVHTHRSREARRSSLDTEQSSTWWKFWGSKGEADKDA